MGKIAALSPGWFLLFLRKLAGSMGSELDTLHVSYSSPGLHRRQVNEEGCFPFRLTFPIHVAITHTLSFFPASVVRLWLPGELAV